MTNDCSRIYNILGDWALLESQEFDRDRLYAVETVKAVIGTPGSHSQRLSFALSLMLGVEPEDCLKALDNGACLTKVQSVLDRCVKKAYRIKIS